MSNFMIGHDPLRCISCRACEVHCQVKNGVPADIRPGMLITVGPVRLSGKVQVRSAFRPCFHCEKPWCVAVCPTGAMVKGAQDGLVHILSDLCVGCRACIAACPWKVPQWDPSTGKVIKCDGCRERVTAGLVPACVAGCTTRALSFARPNANVRQVRMHYAKDCLIAQTAGGARCAAPPINSRQAQLKR
jgi:Fe-S-cluster-containing dehydrogenase component